MTETKDNISTFYASSRKAWREWLKKNGKKEKSVWLIIYKKESGTPSVYYGEAVDEALCFGWIDSKANKRDEKSYYQFFARRNPKSSWSRVNKQKVSILLEQGLMDATGLAAIETAKKNGAWSALDEVEDLVIPADLQAALKKNKEAMKHFAAFPKSVKRGILEWISNAKRTETRTKRIDETVALAEENIRANQYKPKKKQKDDK
ncbi:MAG TPA: YdeI/OmpD-associated family protein [Flavisolibacter sp.]|nr:YdeI/OmpD-associated family protein [Flavisolibacter sp.]